MMKVIKNICRKVDFEAFFVEIMAKISFFFAENESESEAGYQANRLEKRGEMTLKKRRF